MTIISRIMICTHNSTRIQIKQQFYSHNIGLPIHYCTTKNARVQQHHNTTKITCIVIEVGMSEMGCLCAATGMRALRRGIVLLEGRRLKQLRVVACCASEDDIANPVGILFSLSYKPVFTFGQSRHIIVSTSSADGF